MTSRRSFLGGALAASALGCVGFAREAEAKRARAATVEFYPPSPGADRPGAFAGQLGRPEAVELGSLEVGHFHGLMHERDGSIAYLYEAAIRGPRPRLGFMKLGEPGAFPLA